LLDGCILIVFEVLQEIVFGEVGRGMGMVVWGFLWDRSGNATFWGRGASSGGMALGG